MNDYTDYHMHSRFSGDGRSSLEEMCRAAQAREIQEVCFTEHVDFAPGESGVGYFAPDRYLAEIDRCRRLFEDSLKIKAGVELGDPHIFPAECERVMAAHDYDFAIGSVHWVSKRPAFSAQLFPRPKNGNSRLSDQEVWEVWNSYFLAAKGAVLQGGFSVLGHFDLPKRTTADRYPFEPEKHEPLIREVLSLAIERGIGLEINTSGLRSVAHETLPGRTILGWYRELGGRILTVGSDSHGTNHAGFCIPEGFTLAEEVGFTEITRFTKMRPE